MCIWNFRMPVPPGAQDQNKNPTYGFSIVKNDFSPTPAYTLLQQQSGHLNLAYTGAYDAASRLIQHGSDWALAGSGENATLSPSNAGATATIDFSGTRLDLLLSGAAQGLSVSIDGHAVRLKPATGASTTTNPATRLTVASGLADGPHRADIVAGGAGTLKLDGFVVVRRTLNSWIYPWIYAGLALALALNLASFAWVLRRFRRAPEDEVAVERVFSAAELRAARMTSEQRRP